MSAFGNGTIFGTIDYGQRFLFTFHVQAGYGQSRRYDWSSARIRLVGSDMSARIPSRADLLKIAAYLDNVYGVGVVRHKNSANAQLEAYLGHIQTVPAALPVAA